MIELKNIRHWIFDLDNTLYPNTTNLFDKIDAIISNPIMISKGQGRKRKYISAEKKKKEKEG